MWSLFSGFCQIISFCYLLGGKNYISFCCPPRACLQPGSSVAGPAVWGHTVNIRELMWLQSKHPYHHSPACFCCSFLVIYFTYFPPKSTLINLFHWHFGEKSLHSSPRQDRMGTAFVHVSLLHCNLLSVKWSVLTEILPALHRVLLEMLLIFGCKLK